MGKINQTTATIQKLINTMYHTPMQDLVDGLHTVSSPQAIVGGVETRFTNNGVIRNYFNGPSHITSIWNTTTNVASFANEMNNPMYVIRIELTVDPAGVGTMEFKLYINDTVPKLIQTASAAFKNNIARESILFTFYLGEEVGYDVKNNGVYLTITPDVNVDVYDKTLLIYRT